MTALNQRLAAEAVGTGMLVSGVIGSGIMAERLAGGNMALALLCNTIATGAILTVLIAVLGSVSGAHFNPAVSLVFWRRGDLGPRELSCYVLAQIAGGVLGTLAAHGMFDASIFQLSEKARSGPSQWFSEGVATFGLILIILGTLQSRPEAIHYTVGLYITAAYWFTASTSFANPAVTIARSLTNSFSGIAPASTPLFIVAQCVGAGLAALFSQWLFANGPCVKGSNASAAFSAD